METDVLKHFIGKNVEILVGGAWVEGHMQPIVKGLITLLPVGELATFYGPTAVKAESVQAIRHLKKTGVLPVPAPEAGLPANVRSSLDQVEPGKRFVHERK